MSPSLTSKVNDPHSKRMSFDTTDWHDRLERLVQMRGTPSEGEPLTAPSEPAG
jgi:heme oxygenase